MRKFDKKGAEKYYLIVSLILGLIVVALCLYFIFNEYFTDKEINWETCRQSIIMRANLPDAKVAGLNIVSFKDKFPLKCKTEVMEIDYEDVAKAENEIAKTMVSCWNLFLNGENSVFSSKVYGVSSSCVACARIAVSPSVRSFYVQEYIDKAKNKVDNRINLERALNSEISKGTSYKNYLNNVGKFPAFNPASAREFNLIGEKFKVDSGNSQEVTLKNTRTGKTETGNAMSRVDLPKYLDPNDGLLIVFGTLTSSSDSGVGDYVPYLAYFHTKDKEFSETSNRLVDGPLWHNIDFCENWDGVPA